MMAGLGQTMAQGAAFGAGSSMARAGAEALVALDARQDAADTTVHV